MDYSHKKFSGQKRKRGIDQTMELDKENFMPSQSQPAKRRQTKSFFRPWLDNEQNIEAGQQPAETPKRSAPAQVSQYHANMVRSHASRSRSLKEQQRRDRNTLACLLSRRANQAQVAHMERQYEQYRAQHAAIQEQQLRLGLYYRQLWQQAVFQRGVSATGFPLPQQQQQFLQQMALSQQLLVFGSQH